MVLGQVSAPNDWIEFCSGSFTWCQVRLGQVSSPNVWKDSVHYDVTDISEALVTAQSINKRSVTRCQVRLGWVRLGQFSKRLDSLHDHVTVISDALVTAQSINEDSVTWCQVRLVSRNNLIAILNLSVLFCKIRIYFYT